MEEVQTATIDADLFARTFTEALPEETAKLRAKMKAAQASGANITPEHFAMLDTLDTIRGDFCQLWPEANRSLDAVEYWIGFISPRTVAIMNAIEAAINRAIIPVVCPATRPPASAPAPTVNPA